MHFFVKRGFGSPFSKKKKKGGEHFGNPIQSRYSLDSVSIYYRLLKGCEVLLKMHRKRVESRTGPSRDHVPRTTREEPKQVQKTSSQRIKNNPAEARLLGVTVNGLTVNGLTGYFTIVPSTL